ncbi:hypothetical protein H311_03233 [Anncaliia algerae PRA109]|nr:hypothetical protein H311_03233 [Anncaliia algerae PRA109]
MINIVYNKVYSFLSIEKMKKIYHIYINTNLMIIIHYKLLNFDNFYIPGNFIRFLIYLKIMFSFNLIYDHNKCYFIKRLILGLKPHIKNVFNIKYLNPFIRFTSYLKSSKSISLFNSY